ncbi:MAG: SHOCT domain-containing protein [Patescibacteria group bacterium]
MNDYYNSTMNGGYVSSSAMGFLSMIVWWGVLVVMILILFRLVSGHRSAVRGHSSPMEILKERYAKGEIDKEEFNDKKKDLI